MKSILNANGQLFYFKYGNGSKILLAFHGFGQDNKIFEDWAEIIGSTYTVYAFDLFHHGNSTRLNKKLSKDEWKVLLQEFLAKENVSKFSILGFSLGGRFAISSALALPNQIQELILIAPDGILLTIWFKIATSPGFKRLFKYFMLNPSKLDSLIRFNDRYRVVSPYLGDFVKKELGDASNRKRVYVSWNNFKTLGYSHRSLSKLFNQYNFKRRIILGSKDHIIEPNKILPIIDRMGNFKVDILPMKHHQLIKQEVANLILEVKE